jgi:hypothetical protein
MAKLLPIRHPTADFFIADIFDGLPVKDDIASMEHPFYGLSNKPRFTQYIEYKREGVSVCISPSSRYGMPTIFDKDILLYCGSLIMSELKKHEMMGTGLPSKTLRISVHDLLITINRSICGTSYNLLEEALKRLNGVSINTNIKTNGIEQVKGFHLIESFEFIKSHYVKDRRIALEITVSDWFYNSIIGKEVLTINRDYFRLGKGIERRLYELARKHCGYQNEWRVSMQTLYEKSGAVDTLPKFRSAVKSICKDNHIPDYTIAILEGDIVLFKNRTIHAQLADENIPSLSPETIRKGAILVEKAQTGWDYQEICSQFNQELIKGFRPDKIDGAFIRFVEKKIQQPASAYVAPTKKSTTKNSDASKEKNEEINIKKPTSLEDEKPEKRRGILSRLLS